MTKIKNYVVDTKVKGEDRWIGSDADNRDITKNFTADGIGNYFSEEGTFQSPYILTFRYQDVDSDRPSGSLSFETIQGGPVQFSAVTEVIVNEFDRIEQYAPNYLMSIIGSTIQISREYDIDQHGIYVIEAVEPFAGDPGNFKLTLSYQGGNGQLEIGDYYGVFPIGDGGSGGGIDPGFRRVDEGNGFGYVPFGRVDANYGPIGKFAFDLSFSTSASNVRGSTGEGSVTAGYNCINNETYGFNTGYLNQLGADSSGTGYVGYNSVVSGWDVRTHNNSQFNLITGRGHRVGVENSNSGTTTNKSWYNIVTGIDNVAYAGVAGGMIGANLRTGAAGSLVIGISNIDRTALPTNQLQNATWFTADHGNALFVIGNGFYNTANKVETLSNAMEVYHSGAINLSSLTDNRINTADDFSAVTKGWTSRNFVRQETLTLNLAGIQSAGTGQIELIAASEVAADEFIHPIASVIAVVGGSVDFDNGEFRFGWTNGTYFGIPTDITTETIDEGGYVNGGTPTPPLGEGLMVQNIGSVPTVGDRTLKVVISVFKI